MKELRLHGRAGQGMVTGAEIIAIAAGLEGKYSQAFPFFGSEKRGPPVEAYCRVDDKPIRIHEEITEPDIVIVADSSILEAVDVCKGMKENGIVIINTNKPVAELGLKAKHIFAVDATEVALKYFGRLILNTVMLGAFCKAINLVKLDSVKKAAREKLSAKLSDKIVDKNIEAIQAVYDLMDVKQSEVVK